MTKTFYRRIDRANVREIGIMLSEMVDFFQLFFIKVTSDTYIDDKEKISMSDSLEEIKGKIDKIIVFIKKM